MLSGRCHTHCRKKSSDFGTSHLGQVPLGYIAAHASTRGCVRTQCWNLGALSDLGPNRKSSRRAYVFRFTLELGHCSTQSACLKRANPGADPGQGGDYAKACSHVCSDPEIFHFSYPNPNGDPLLIKRERCLIN